MALDGIKAFVLKPNTDGFPDEQSVISGSQAGDGIHVDELFSDEEKVAQMQVAMEELLQEESRAAASSSVSANSVMAAFCDTEAFSSVSRLRWLLARELRSDSTTKMMTKPMATMPPRP